MENRRQFYRINDKISLNYYVIGSSDPDEADLQAHKEFKDLAVIRKSMFDIDEKLNQTCTRLSEDNPLILEIIDLLNQKFTVYENYLMRQDSEKEMSPAGDVNLSANGVAFETDIPLIEGSNLQLEMIIFPENYYIPVYSRVISCRKNRNDSDTYSIAVEFVAMSDNDREVIVHHVLKKQAEELRLLREADTMPIDETVESEAVS